MRGLALLTVLYSSAALVGLQVVIDPDIWWHLRTGQWIVEHRAVPWTDPFSTFGQGKVWLEYSWLYDLAIYGLYEVAGLRGFIVYQFVLILAIAVALHRLVALVEPRLARGAALTAMALLSMTRLFGPRSYLVSILFFILVLIACMEAYSASRTRPLWLLPGLFVVWANVHIQFIYGFAILAAFTVDAALARWWDRTGDGRLSLPTLLAVDAACVLATLATPYHLRQYLVMQEYASQTMAYWVIIELRSLQFRDLQDWAALGLTLAAAFVLHRARQPRFLMFLFVIGVFVSFRSKRDVWFIVVCATVIVAMAEHGWPPAIPELWRVFRRARWIAVAVAVGTFALLLSTRSPRDLEAWVKSEFPDGAAAAVEKEGYAGPIYNHFNWGGYLIWRLPAFQVSMDGRSNLHGDTRILRSMRTWAGLEDWRSDVELAAAGVVIADNDMALASLLPRDDRFREVYRDDRARVFVARAPAATPARAK